MIYSIYSDAGQFLRTLTCWDERTLEINTAPGEQVFADVENPAAKQVVDGALVDLPPVVPALDAIKAQRWGAVRAQRDQAEYGGFDYAGGQYQSGMRSQLRILIEMAAAQAALASGAPFQVSWRLADNTEAQLDAAAMVQLGLALAAHVESCHIKGDQLRERINAATTAQEVDGIVW